MIFIFLAIFWLVWEIKYILFWLYLWQLKDYHVGRFVDHFSTHKGKRLIFNTAQILKLVLFFLFISRAGPLSYLYFIFFLIYFFQDLFVVGAFAKNLLKKPVKTAKVLLLSFFCGLLLAVVLLIAMRSDATNQVALLLEFDLLTPLIISVIALLPQPIFVVIRSFFIAKAAKKMGKIKGIGQLKVIAITGSFGKTSTKEFLATILSKKFNVLKTKNHQNSEIGVARCILNDLSEKHQIFIAEVGAYNKGKVREVALMVKPDIGIVTGVNEQHLSLFGSMKKLLSAEGGAELAKVLGREGTLITNGDNKYCLDLHKKADVSNKKIYSARDKSIDADVWAADISVLKNSISFVILDKAGNLAHVDAKVLGKQNVQNLLAAVLAASELGMGFSDIAEACKEIVEAQAGMVLKQEKHGIYIIDSSYSANPDGVAADLDYLSIFGGRKIIVMPSLIELGKKSGETHERIGKKIGGICDMAIVTTKDRFKEIKKGAIESGMSERNILLCDNPHDIFSIITLFCKLGDAVLLEGRVPDQLTNLLK